MKALTLERREAFDIIQGKQTALIRKRSVPRHMIGRAVVIHAKRSKDGPGCGVGVAKFGEAEQMRGGQMRWPVVFCSPWAELVVSPGAAGFWDWQGSEDVVF